MLNFPENNQHHLIFMTGYFLDTQFNSLYNIKSINGKIFFI